MIEESKIKSIGSISAERALLGLLFDAPELIVQVMAKLDDSDFSQSSHKYVYMAMKYLAKRDNDISPMSVYSVLERKSNILKIIEEQGGLEYLVGLQELSEFDAKDFDFYVDTIKQCSVRRQLLSGINTIIPKLMTDNESDTHKILNSVESLALDTSMKNVKNTAIKHMAEDLADILKELEDNKGKLPGLTTGFPAFDNLMYGLNPNTVTVIGSRPKVGKSSIGMNIALLNAMKGIPVLTFDTEMSTKETQIRALSALSQIPHDEILTGAYAKDEVKHGKVAIAKQRLESCKWFHIFEPNFTAEMVQNIVRMYQLKENIGLFIFDYIKAPSIKAMANSREDQWLGELTNALKNIAGVCGIPVLTFAQTSQFEEDKIAYSDKIKQLATCISILKVKTKEKYVADGGSIAGNYTLTITDIRSGKPGVVNLNHKGEVLTFTQAEVQPEDD